MESPIKNREQKPIVILVNYLWNRDFLNIALTFIPSLVYNALIVAFALTGFDNQYTNVRYGCMVFSFFMMVSTFYTLILLTYS